MKRRLFLMGIAGGGLVAACSSEWSGDKVATAAPLSAEEHRRTIEGLRPPKRRRPLVAIVADNRGSETTDLMIPYAVLTRSGIADVAVLAPDQTPIILMPALSIEPQLTFDAFDLAHPEGADYVIVPAFHHDDQEGPILDWLRKQVASRATIIGICEGARVIGRAGFLDGRRATTHWYAVDSLKRAHPTMTWVPDRRYVVDRGVVTTTGVTASIPLSLALVEAIAGPIAATELSARIGVEHYDATHHSAHFRLGPRSLYSISLNSVAVWNHEIIGIPVLAGVDDISLALSADAWSRTYRSKAVAMSKYRSIRTLDGLKVLINPAPGEASPDVVMPVPESVLPAQSLDVALERIFTRHGGGTSGIVALQLEYLWREPE